MNVGILHIPVQLRESAELARRAEQLGIEALGVADSPRIFGSLYPTIQHSLAETRIIRIGPLVTNPVTRHSSVHASTCKAFEELHPGRNFLGIGVGDSAVHGVGQRPGDPADVAELAVAVRGECPDLPIATAIGGPKAASAVSTASDTILFGCGFDARQIARLRACVPPTSVERRQWIYVPSYLVPEAAAIPAARRAVRAPVVSFSRHALYGDMVGKGVPSQLVPGLTALYDRYAFSEHSRLASSNARLMEGRSAEAEYLFDRFALVDTPSRAAEKVADFAAEIGDFDIFLGTLVPDVNSHLEILAGQFKARLEKLS